MALYHHGSEKYEEAASKAAKAAKATMEALINRGRTNAMTVMEKIEREVPQDRIVKGPAMRFQVNPQDCIEVAAGAGSFERIHKNAGQQLCERGPISLPAKFANDLLDGERWHKELLTHNLQDIYAHSKEKYLTRSYDGQMRGFLSNKFRRLDSRPIINSAMTAFQSVGAVPVEAYGTDTKVAFKALLPYVFEPVPNEVMCLGVIWQNSDYGNGAHSLRIFMLRLWCTNYAITEECLREVHLGRRLDDDDVFSSETYELDTRRSASMVKDGILAGLSPESVQKTLAAVKNANEEKVDAKNMSAHLKKTLGAGTAKEVIDAFNSPDVENLPPGNSKWRMSNAISWIAGKRENKEEALQLMQEAGNMLKAA